MVRAKYHAVLDELRQRIADGDLPAGSRMPTWDALTEQYSIGRPTLMRVMAVLRDEGFVIGDATRGTRVTPAPPCRGRFGLVYGIGPEDSGWNHFWQALRDEATAQAARDGWRLVIYDRVNNHGSDGLDELLADLDTHRLAGLMLTTHGALHQLERHLRGRVPVVQMGGRHNARFLGRETAAWQFDVADLYRRASTLLHRAGARRVAVLGTETTDLPAWDRALAEAGLGGEAWWRFSAGISAQRTTANLVHLLCSGDNRPDGLVIADDTLVPAAVSGLLAAGVKVGSELHVAAHCNWPFPGDSTLPLIHVGFDLSRMVREAIAELRAPGDDLTGRHLPAITADEFRTARRAPTRRTLS